MRIALLEDDQDQAELITLWLQDAGYTVFHYAESRLFKAAIKQQSFDLLIMDWLMPDIEGIEVLHWVRSNLDWQIPVLFQTQMESEESIVKALQAGADDYMTKPVRQGELLARISSVIRRSNTNIQKDDAIQDFSPYKLDLKNLKVLLNEEDVGELTSKEFSLIRFLFNNTGRALSRDHILENVWGTSTVLNTRKIDTHISRIRNKLSLGEDNGWRLCAIYQYGYRLEQMNN